MSVSRRLGRGGGVEAVEQLAAYFGHRGGEQAGRAARGVLEAVVFEVGRNVHHQPFPLVMGTDVHIHLPFLVARLGVLLPQLAALGRLDARQQRRKRGKCTAHSDKHIHYADAHGDGGSAFEHRRKHCYSLLRKRIWHVFQVLSLPLV